MTASKQTVLVTGATGYIGAHVVDQLLKKGYRVRAAVRNQQKAELLAERFSEYKDKLEFVFVDLSRPDSFTDAILSGVNGVLHVAAPLVGALKTSVKTDYLDPAIEGNLALLRAVARNRSIKRVVITSSLAAIVNTSTGTLTLDPAHVYSEKDWNPVTYEQAVSVSGPEADLVGYIGSKTLAEKAAFDFVELNKPGFDIATILPTFVFGPAVLADGISSLSIIRDCLWKKTEVEASLPFHWVVDVREVATAHVLAYENPKASNQRYILTAEPFAFQQIVDIAHESFPGKTNAPKTPCPAPLPPWIIIDNSKSKKELGVVYRSKRATIEDSISNLLEFRQQGKL